MLVRDRRTLLWLVDYGCVDLHVWTSRIDKPDRADGALLDLGPADALFDAVVEVRAFARVMAETLRRVGVRGVKLDVKMNGHGQQIVAPYSVRPVRTAGVATPLRWDEVRAGIAPDDYTPHVVRARVAEHGDLAGPLLVLHQSISAAL